MKRFGVFLASIMFLLAMVNPCFSAAGLTTGDQTIYGHKTFEHNLIVKGKLTAKGAIVGFTGQHGDEYYVCSTNGHDSAGNYGTSFDMPFATVDYAVNQTTANQGDIIYVLPGHAESYTAADGFDVDVAGVTVIGIGIGTDMPEFTFADTDATIAIGAANVTLYNLRFIAGIHAIVIGIAIEAAGDNALIQSCEFPEPTTNTFDFIDAIDFAAGADGVKIVGNTYFHADAVGPAHFIEMGNGVNNNTQIIDNYVFGEFSVACIWSDTADLETVISGGSYTNMTTIQFAIEFTGAATGHVDNVILRTDDQTIAIDPGSMTIGPNVFWDKEDSANSIAIPVILASAGPGSIGPLNSTTTDSIHGKIGTDTEMADSSLYDLNVADQIDLDAILADTSAMDTNTEINVLWAHPRCVEKSDGSVPANTTDDLFTITGGPIRAKIVGIVTTVLGDVAASGKLQITTTAPAATAELNAGAVVITSDAAGTSYRNVGGTSVFTPVTAGVVLIDPVTVEDVEFLLPIGTVKFHSTAANTGNIKWYMTYTPLSPNSVVVAAD